MSDLKREIPCPICANDKDCWKELDRKEMERNNWQISFEKARAEIAELKTAARHLRDCNAKDNPHFDCADCLKANAVIGE